MKKYYTTHPWKIIEDGFSANMHQASESIFSIGNGKMGTRANFEESYTGKSLKGTYIGGIYYPDKTRVGWWKNGYPEYFAKVLNAPDFLSIDIKIDSETLDLASWKIRDFYRELDMYNGILRRSFIAISPAGKTLQVNSQRFISMDNPKLAVIKYTIKAINNKLDIILEAKIDGDVINQDSNYDEQFWDITDLDCNKKENHLIAQTKKSGFVTGMAMKCKLNKNAKEIQSIPEYIVNEKSISERYTIEINPDETVCLEKYIAVVNSLDYEQNEIKSIVSKNAQEAEVTGYNLLYKAHSEWWQKKWETCSIEIEGDDEAQQGIRFNIFQLYQTYTGIDPKLNIGPKGFTGEKYGGTTYWDTEAYCLPFYMSTAGEEVARNLLMYRYKHLEKAILNAEKLGLKNGAALYPMVTINGEECHNEWEITFEEIHRNGAIAYAIYYYTSYTGDKSYIEEYGLEVLIGIARFWAERVNYSQKAKKYMILGVTGPNEYENNVNNNWYTNYIAAWCLRYTSDEIQKLKSKDLAKFEVLVNKLNFDLTIELNRWKEIFENMHFPYDDKFGLIMQQDGYLDKDQIAAKDIPPEQRPINQHWSWDKILRSCFIKQADVMQGLYFFEDDFDFETIKKNYEFYEPRTVHESSLSPCIYSIQASYLDKKEEAYNLYLRTSRLDLDDYNNEVHEGLHITSMAGTWMSIIKGFGGLRVKNNKLHFSPKIPDNWKRLSFHINFRNRLLKVNIGGKSVDVLLINGNSIEVIVNDVLMKLT